MHFPFLKAKKEDFATQVAQKAFIETMLKEGTIDAFLIIVPGDSQATVDKMAEAGELPRFISAVEEHLRNNEHTHGRNKILNALGRVRKFRGNPETVSRTACTPGYDQLFQWLPE